MKQTGLGANFYIAGYDLSGDVSALNTVHGGHGVADVTPISNSAVERLLLNRDGDMDITSWFNAVALQEHAAFKSLPDTDVLATACFATTLGDPAAVLWAKQATYDLDRGSDGSLSVKAQLLADGYGLDWGTQLTAGKVTIASAANGTSVDMGNADYATVNITSNSIANPSVVYTATAHGLVSGDSVTIAGVSTSSPTINGNWPILYVDPTHFSVPVNVTVAGTGGTVVKTSGSAGAASYLQVFSVATNTVTVQIQHSADNGAVDTWANVTGLVHTAQSARFAGERVAVTIPVKRWLRIVTSGAFSNAVISVVVARYYTAPV